jgi:hypothetical protein
VLRCFEWMLSSHLVNMPLLISKLYASLRKTLPLLLLRWSV